MKITSTAIFFSLFRESPPARFAYRKTRCQPRCFTVFRVVWPFQTDMFFARISVPNWTLKCYNCAATSDDFDWPQKEFSSYFTPVAEFHTRLLSQETVSSLLLLILSLAPSFLVGSKSPPLKGNPHCTRVQHPSLFAVNCKNLRHSTSAHSSCFFWLLLFRRVFSVK